MSETTQFQPETSQAAGPKASRLVRLCDAVIQWSLFGLVLLMPLFFLPWTIEVVELNKQLLLLVGAALAGFAWLGKMLAERKFEYRKSIVNVIVFLFFAVYSASAVLSKSRYMSIAGDFGQEKSGLVTLLAFIVIYFVVVNNIRTAEQLKRILLGSVVSGFIAGLYGLLQGLNVFIMPFDFAKTASFNTVGTAAALGIFMAYVVTLCGGMILDGHGKSKPGDKKALAYNIFLAVTGALGIFLVAVIGFWPLTVSLFIASALLIGFAFVHAKSMKGIGGILLPVFAFIVTALLLFFRSPVQLNFPAEVMPSMKATANIAVQTLRERPLLGSGPGTFIFDYAKFRDADVNKTAFWNLRFDRGTVRFLTLVATTGLFGALSWLLVAIFLLVSAGRRLLKADEQTWHTIVSIFAAWFLLVLVKFLYSSTITLEFVTWLTMALLVVVHRPDFFSVKFENSPRSAMVLSFVLIFSVVFALSGLFVEGTRYAGEVAYASAIRMDAAGGDIEQIINKLVSSANLNQSNDVYLRNLSTALVVKADKLAAEPFDTAKKDKESDDDYQKRMQAAQQDRLRKIAQLTADAVNTAKRAQDLNPENVANASVLASIYQNLIGVSEGAEDWSVKSYQRAIELEPANPAFHTELGKVLVIQSDESRQAMSDTKDEKVKAEAEKKMNDLLAQAVDEYNKALTLKPDYAPAHFNLSLALDRQGKLKEAITKMENAIQLNNQDVGAGFQLALLYYRDGRKDQAIKLLESVITLSPNYSNARWYLAAMYEEKGGTADLDAAIAQITKVKELNPGNEMVAKKLDDLTKKKTSVGLPEPVEQPVTNVNEPGVKKP